MRPHSGKERVSGLVPRGTYLDVFIMHESWTVHVCVCVYIYIYIYIYAYVCVFMSLFCGSMDDT